MQEEFNGFSRACKLFSAIRLQHYFVLQLKCQFKQFSFPHISFFNLLRHIERWPKLAMENQLRLLNTFAQQWMSLQS